MFIDQGNPYPTQHPMQTVDFLSGGVKPQLNPEIDHCSFDEEPYLLCNEQGQFPVIEKLRVPYSSGRTLHMGCSCWFNFDLIAARKSSHALLFDVNRQMFELYELIQKAVSEAPTRLAFVPRFIDLYCQRFPAMGDYHIDHILGETNSSYGWLGDDENYAHVKSLFDSKCIQFIHLDLETSEYPRIIEIKHWIQEQGLHLDTFYSSNVVEWVSRQEAFRDRVSFLLSSQTIHIDACRKKALGGSPSLRWTIGEVMPVPYRPQVDEEDDFEFFNPIEISLTGWKRDREEPGAQPDPKRPKL